MSMEAQGAQLREAVRTLNEIVSTQSTQAANHTSMGLLLANTAASQTAQERSIRDELAQIKNLLRDRAANKVDGVRHDAHVDHVGQPFHLVGCEAASLAEAVDERLDEWEGVLRSSSQASDQSVNESISQ